jgi:hypothetical protein
LTSASPAAQDVGIATWRNSNEELILRFGSPTIYRTDRGSWVVQGWVVRDPEALASMSIPAGETAVEIPDRMLQFFGQGDRALDN